MWRPHISAKSRGVSPDLMSGGAVPGLPEKAGGVSSGHASHQRLLTPRPRVATGVLCAVLFLTFLDNTIVAGALAAIQSSLHPGVVSLQWIVDGYALVFAVLMLAGGTLGDLVGRKRVMLGGIATFAAGSVVAALAPSTGVLVAGRVVMGAGAAACEPGTLSVIRQLFPDRRDRARALGAWAATSGLALAMGPMIAGIIVGLSSWREVFWFNLAFGVVVFFLALAFVPESSDPVGRRFDVTGILFTGLAIGAGTGAVIAGESAGYGAWWVDLLFTVAVSSAVALVWSEKRRADPLLDRSIVQRSSFAVANVVGFAVFFAVFAIFFFVALYLQLVANASPYVTAADFTPMAVAMILASALTGLWVARQGPRVPMSVGCALAAAGVLATEILLGPHAGIARIGVPLAVAGAGFGITLVPVTSAALGSVAAARSGTAASATNASRELGAVVGVAVLGSIVNSELTGHLLARLRQLGIPPNFQAIVIAGVTHGAVPSTASASANPLAAGQGKLVAEVIAAAEGAFSDGLHAALVLATVVLALAALLAGLALRQDEVVASAAADSTGADSLPKDSPGAHSALFDPPKKKRRDTP